MISAVVLTRNEEKNIAKCLQSLSWCNEIILIDDNSNDNTDKIARSFKAKVYQRKLNNNYSQQRNFGLKKAQYDWVFFIDADERVTVKLQDEIIKNCNQSKDYVGFLIRRKDFFLGQWLNFGETASVKLLRLAKKDKGRWQGKVHEVWTIKGKTKMLKNKIYHFKNINITEFIKKIDCYSSIRARYLYQSRVKTNLFFIIIYPLAKFFLNYVFRLGFLDGIPGLIMALMMSFHSFLVRAKLYLLWQKND